MHSTRGRSTARPAIVNEEQAAAWNGPNGAHWSQHSARRAGDADLNGPLAGAVDAAPGGRLVIFGGYGAVGRAVAESLAALFPDRVVIAGRDGARAAATAERIGHGARPQRLDVTDPDDVTSALRGAAVAAMCVERENVRVARSCLERGVSYVDVSATTSVLASIRELHDVAVQHGATAAISVGLAPGITNLLARQCHQRLPSPTGIDISMVFGLAGDHGADSRRWVIDGLSTRGHAAARRTRVALPGFGLRTAYPFPFSDQDTLTAELGLPVTTRLCFESALATAAVFGLRATRAFELLDRVGARRLVDASLAGVRLGSDRFVVHAQASDEHGRRAVAAATGRGECRATATVAARVAARLAAGAARPGVWHLDELVEPAAFLAELESDHLTTALST
jgi:saccharopine dehydrogenase-like NADP-dependent oxidoreductase